MESQSSKLRWRAEKISAADGRERPAFTRLRDAAPIVKAMRAVPEHRRMDAVAAAVDAFCQTGGRLR